MSEADQRRDPRSPSVMYNYVRARQLEGTFPGDHETGTWVTTAMRVAAGWGSVEERFWPHTGLVEDWPPIEPTLGLDELAKDSRICCYQRVRSVDDARRILSRHGPFIAALQISSAWFNAPDGVIDIGPKHSLMDKSHAVIILGYNDRTRQLRFANSWGANWGDRGFGSMSYDYFMRFMTEAWVMIVSLEGDSRQDPPSGKIVLSVFGLNDASGEYVLHGVDLHEGGSYARLGWAFALQTENALEVEELFIKPSFRGKRWASKIIMELRELSERLGLPLTAWVPHIDSDRRNLAVADRLFAHVGCHRRLSKIPWATWKFHSVMRPTVARSPEAFGKPQLPARPGTSFAEYSPEATPAGIRGPS